MTQDDRVVVNPNSADLETLMTLPGVGESMAQRILDARPFVDREDMQRINGMGPATLARMKPYLTFKTKTDAVDIVDKPADESTVDKPISQTELRKDGGRPKTATRPKRSRGPQQTISRPRRLQKRPVLSGCLTL